MPPPHEDVNERAISLPARRTRPDQRHSPPPADPTRPPQKKIIIHHDLPLVLSPKSSRFPPSLPSSRTPWKSRVLAATSPPPPSSSSRSFPRSNRAQGTRRAAHRNLFAFSYCSGRATCDLSTSMAMAAPWSSSCCPATASTSAPRPLGPGSLKGAAWPVGGAGWRNCREQGRNSRRRLSVCATAAAPPPPVDYADTSAGAGADADYVASLKVKLLVSA